MTTGTSADAEATTVEDGKGAEEATPDTPFLKTPTSVYNTEEEATKGFENLQKKMQEQQAELDRIKRDTQQSDALGKLSESIDKMSASAGTEDQQKALEEAGKQYRESLGEDPGKAWDLVQNVDADLRREITAVREASDTKALKEQLDALNAEMDKLKLSSDPVYRDHNDKVQEAITEFGVTEAQAIKIVAKGLESTSQEGDQPLGTTGTRVNTAQGEKPDEIDPQVLAALEAMHGKLSEDEVRKILAKRS